MIRPEKLRDAAPDAGPDELELRHLLRQRALCAHFQPIGSLADGGILGFEGLIRGPAGSSLHTPAALFEAAERCGLETLLDLLCVTTVLRDFARLGLDGRVFVNLNPRTLLDRASLPYELLEELGRLGLAPARVVVELTEAQQSDSSRLFESLEVMRTLGFRLAIDDLGEGFASLKLWSQLRPDFVKIDKHFIRDIESDPLKLAFVRAIQAIAEAAGTQTVAEGIENEATLRVACELGLSAAQGYLLARPAADPVRVLDRTILDCLQRRALPVMPDWVSAEAQIGSVGRLASPVPPASEQTTGGEVFDRFLADPQLTAIAVIDDLGAPIGLLRRAHVMQRWAAPVGEAVHRRRSCLLLASVDALVVDAAKPVREVGQMLSDGDRRHLAAGFIVTMNGRYVGIGIGQDVVREITQLQIAAARYANSLTGLPGSVLVNQHIDLLARRELPFGAVYADLNAFKRFNDVHGYAAGDEVILATAQLLAQACDPHLDFVAHIGGDDFLLVFQSPDWQQRCSRLAVEFDAQLGARLADARFTAGAIEAPTLALGAICVDPGSVNDYGDVVARLADVKRRAKGDGGTRLVLDRIVASPHRLDPMSAVLAGRRPAGRAANVRAADTDPARFEAVDGVV